MVCWGNVTGLQPKASAEPVGANSFAMRWYIRQMTWRMYGSIANEFAPTADSAQEGKI
jgi:hypothetical protein